MRGFGAVRFAGIGDRTRMFGRARAVQAPAGVLILFWMTNGARAQDAAQVLDMPSVPILNFSSVEANIAGLAILLLMLLATITAVLHLLGRRIWTRRVRELEAELGRTNAKLDRASLILRSESQIVVSWDRPDAEPAVEGEFTLVADAPAWRRILSYAAWLEPAVAAESRGRDGAVVEARRGFFYSCGEPARAASRNRRPARFRQRRHANPRRLGRQAATGAIAR